MNASSLSEPRAETPQEHAPPAIRALGRGSKKRCLNHVPKDATNVLAARVVVAGAAVQGLKGLWLKLGRFLGQKWSDAFGKSDKVAAARRVACNAYRVQYRRWCKWALTMAKPARAVADGL
jgi:hypothetical protein